VLDALGLALPTSNVRVVAVQGLVQSLARELEVSVFLAEKWCVAKPVTRRVQMKMSLLHAVDHYEKVSRGNTRT
jgi:hypothetical protein